MRRYAASPRLARQDLALAADLREFKRRYAFLGGGPRRSASTGEVLVIGLSDFVAQLKTESLFAKALELRGLKPAVATQSRLKRAHDYYRVFGFDRLLFCDKHVPAEAPVAAQGDIEALLTSGASFDDIQDFRYRGIEVGRQALATLLRSLHAGRLELEDPTTSERLRSLLLGGTRWVEAAEAVLDGVRPTVALINDAMYVGVGAVFEGALRRKIPVIQWVGSQRDDAFALKRFDLDSKRTHPFSLSESTWAAVRVEPWTPERESELRADFDERYVEAKWDSYYNRPYGRMVDESEVVGRLGLDPGKKTATVFSHILWDSTLFWGEDLFEHYEEWLVETVRAACANPAVNWIVKFHPGNVWKLKRDGVPGIEGDRSVLAASLGELPAHVKLLAADTDISPFALFGVTDYCLTVRGTIGIEMAPFGIPVLTAGTGRYSNLGFTIDSASREEYLARLARIQEQPALSPEQTELAKKYAHALFIRRPARFQSFRWVYRSLEDVGHPLDHNVEIRLSSLDELERAPDFEAFADWALSSDEPDFVMPQSP